MRAKPTVTKSSKPITEATSGGAKRQPLQALVRMFRESTARGHRIERCTLPTDPCWFATPHSSAALLQHYHRSSRIHVATHASECPSAECDLTFFGETLLIGDPLFHSTIVSKAVD